MDRPTFHDVVKAKHRIAPYLARTPLHTYPAINSLIGTDVYIKHENYQPVGAFKVRGGINLVSQMTADERACGLITASTGNHGQSVAYAGRLFGVKVQIVVPEGANPGKVAAMRGMGADVIFHGERFDEARQQAETLGREHGYRHVHAGNEPHLIAGVGTIQLEMLEDVPDLDVIFVPVGGGSGAAGACITAKAINPAIRIIGVQSSLSPAAYQSWKAKRVLSATNQTFAEGVATGVGFELPQAILWDLLDDFVLVSDDDLMCAITWMVERAHTLAEAAGAAPLAAAYEQRGTLGGKKVGLVCSGGNTSLEHLRMALDLANCGAQL
ncbi:MAG TPA: threonine/serine dehydratase [Aggregatilineaceae bacterium]|nr:threonine/serine dehydratase [Aggregatilineaceae bacterium]